MHARFGTYISERRIDMNGIVTFGELMMRLTPPGFERFTQCNNWCITFGGAEANVSVALSAWGNKSAFVSKMPCHEIGQAAVNSLAKFGVCTDNIVRGGDRLGVYYLEKGAGFRPSKVIYDRKNSAFALSVPGEYDWNKIFDNYDWLHVTGITAALGENAFMSLMNAVKIAKERGVTVSFDVNYRSKLWTKSQAGETIKKILPYVDVLIANENQIAEVVGVKSPYPAPENDGYSPESNSYMVRELIKTYGFKAVALTARRTISSDVNTLRAMLATENEEVFSREYRIDIVDRVGSGDAFAAGIIHGLKNKIGALRTVEYATAAATLAHSLEGDYMLCGKDEVEALVQNGSAKVQR